MSPAQAKFQTLCSVFSKLTSFFNSIFPIFIQSHVTSVCVPESLQAPEILMVNPRAQCGVWTFERKSASAKGIFTFLLFVWKDIRRSLGLRLLNCLNLNFCCCKSHSLQDSAQAVRCFQQSLIIVLGRMPTTVGHKAPTTDG